jgi:SAM-dependent methyltransferase
MYRLHRARAAKEGGDLFLAQESVGRLAERLGAINRAFGRALDLHSREAVFPTLQPYAREWVRTGFAWDHPSVIAANEALPFAEESFDLVTSVLSLHAVNDLPGVLLQIRRVLKPDGLFIAALFGGETLRELKFSVAAAESEILGGASPRVAPFADVRDLGGLLQRAGFALPVADVERLTVHYRELPRLFKDLRALGETNMLVGRRNQFISRRFLKALMAEYAARFTDGGGRFAATFEIAFVIGWAPHENQQKALAPGSAKARLAAALGTDEHSAGEKAPR